MKKILSLFFLLIVFISATSSALAAATVPNTSVWFTPSTAAAGEAISLNALVYNSQSFDATVNVAFATADQNVGTVSELIPAQTAKTVTLAWKMPAQDTSITATVSSATDKNKKAVPALVGTIGTIIVGPNVATPAVPSVSFPDSSQISAWFAPILASIDAYRAKEATHFISLRDQSKAVVGTTISSAPAVAMKDGLSSKVLGNPMEYLTYGLYYALATLFANSAIFYIALVLVILLVLRFVANLIL
jgi:hypothetical protein